MDVYFGLLTVWLWIAYREASVGQRFLLWFPKMSAQMFSISVTILPSIGTPVGPIVLPG